MLRLVIVASLAMCTTAAGGYGSSGGGRSSGAYGSSSGSRSSGYGGGRSSSGSYGGGMSGMTGGYSGGSAQGGQVVQAAVQTRHQIEFRDVPSSGDVNPTTIEVGANSVPLNILFRSASSNLNIQQAHDGAQGSVQETSSEDEPHRLVHSVKKPIIQEVHEVITPYRKITQEIQPVQEEILTIVARGQEQQRSSGGYGAGAGASLGGSAKSSAGYGSSSSMGKSYGGASQGKSLGGTAKGY